MPRLQGGSVYGQYLRRIAFQLMKLQDEMLAPHEITSQQARVLGVIALWQEREGGCCQKDLERTMGLRGSSITSLLKGLEQHGYIVRTCGVEDARTKHLEGTEKGLSLLKTFFRIFQRTERRMVEGMSQGEKALLLELLKRAAENLEEPEASKIDSSSK